MMPAERDFDAHIAAARRRLESLQVNSDDLRRFGSYDDAEAAMVADIVRHNVAVIVAVLIKSLGSIDVALLRKEIDRSRLTPGNPARQLEVPDPEARRAADRLREMVVAYLREEPTIDGAADTEIGDS